MEFADTNELITYFLDHVVDVGGSGSSNATLRERAAHLCQQKVNAYWREPWKFKEAQATVTFVGATGIAPLPVDFGSWDRNYGWLVWDEKPHWPKVVPTRNNASKILTARTWYPTRTGPVEAVAMYNGALYRWPTLPPSSADEDAQCFYHRTRPEILDEDPVVDDEWALIPVEDQDLIISGMKAAYEHKSGDARDKSTEQEFRELVRAAYRSRNLDEQPTHLGRPFVAPGGIVNGRVLGNRYFE